MTDSSSTGLSYVAETDEGVTPDTPAFAAIRFTGESLKANISNVSSNEIREDGNIPDLAQVGSAAGGNINFELTYGGWTDDFLAALFRASWATNVLKNGVTPAPLTIEKLFQPAAGDQYHRFVGCRVDTLALSMKANQIVTGTFGIKGMLASSAQAPITDATYGSPNTNAIINAAANFASLSMSGVTSPEVMSIDLNINGNTRQQPVLGSIGAKGIGQGRFMVTGSLSAYFENEEMYELFLNGTGASLAFTLGGVSSKKYAFSMGNIKFSDGEIVAGGNDQDVMANMQFQALYYGSDAATCKVTRTP